MALSIPSFPSRSLLLGLAALLLAPASTVKAQNPSPPDLTAALEIMAATDPAEALSGVDAFLTDFPKSDYLKTILQQGVRMAARQDPASAKVLNYAERYLGMSMEGAPRSVAMAYNSMAWTLYEERSHLERAAEWAEEAIQNLGEDARPSDRPMILDTVAHIAFVRGMHAEAVEVEREALSLEPENADYKAGLGTFLVKTGGLEEAEGLLADALLLNPTNDEATAAFEDLAMQRSGGGTSTAAFKERLLGEAADRLVEESEDTAAVKRQLANSLLSLNVLISRARGFAEEAVEANPVGSGSIDHFQAQILMARVESAEGAYAAVLQRLERVRLLASPWDPQYFLALGKAYEGLDRKEEAIEAYLAGIVPYSRPEIEHELQRLWEGSGRDEATLRETVTARTEALDEWEPEGTFMPGSAATGRVVLAELFTGSECGPCVSSDAAYDHLLEYFPRSALAVLEYHLHIPGPDPMTNSDTEGRQSYYNERERVIGGTPTSIINGSDAIVGGGGAAVAKARFEMYSWQIMSQLESTPRLSINLAGRLEGSTVFVDAGLSWKDTGGLEGHDLRLRVALAERQVDYTGSNGVAHHKMVVRHMFGGPEGTEAIPGDSAARLAARVDLAELQSELLAYLDQWEKDNARRFRATPGWPEKKHEIDESNLVLVAFVQDDTTREVLQAKVLDIMK